jgi:hypothetical protein
MNGTSGVTPSVGSGIDGRPNDALREAVPIRAPSLPSRATACSIE